MTAAVQIRRMAAYQLEQDLRLPAQKAPFPAAHPGRGAWAPAQRSPGPVVNVPRLQDASLLLGLA